MNLSKIQNSLLFLSLALLVIIIYIPAFINDFAIHNDYAMITSKKGSFLGFWESGHLVGIGRPLGAILLSLQSMFIYAISDFRLSRLISLLIGLLTIGLLSRFLYKRCHFKPFWAIIAGFSCLLLPSYSVYILWSTNFVPGTLNLLIAFYSYVLLDLSRKKSNLLGGSEKTIQGALNWLNAFILFFASLLIYPPTSMIVFVLSFILIITRPHTENNTRLKILLRDLIFFGLAMCLYLLFNKVIILPWAEHVLNMNHTSGTTYGLNASFSLWHKAQLILETFGIGIAGIFHLIHEHAGTWINTIVLASLTGYVFVRGEGKSKIKNGLMLGAIFVVYFFIMNAPAFLAEHNMHLIGYRVLWPTAAFFMLIIFWLLQHCESLINQNRLPFLKGIAIVYIIAALFMSYQHNNNVAHNYSSELIFVQNGLLEAKEKNAQNIIVVPRPRGEPIINRRQPYEFSYMLSEAFHTTPIVEEILGRDYINSHGRRFFFIPEFNNNLPLHQNFYHMININTAMPIEKK